MSIGTNIKRLREEHKLTQEQLAEKLGVTYQAVSSWEREEYRPDTDKLIKLAAVLMFLCPRLQRISGGFSRPKKPFITGST